MNIGKRVLLIIIMLFMIQILLPGIGIMKNFVGFSMVEAADTVQTWNLSKTENDNVLATLKSDGSLIISGTGNMKNWRYNNEDVAEWHEKINNISKLTIEEGITSIGERTFMRCIRLKNIKLPSTIAKIETFAFDGCASLESIEINGYFTLYPTAFTQCDELTKLKITKDVEKISKSIISSINNLEEIEVDQKNTHLKTIDGILYNYDVSELIGCPPKKEGKVIIPNGVKIIGDMAFQSCKNITEIEIPSSVETIEKYAFNICDSLKKINIPGSVKVLKEKTFWQCKELEEVIFEEGVKEIEFGGIQNCIKVKIIKIPSTLEKIDKGAFVGDSGITNFVVDEENNNYCSENGILYNKDKSVLIRYTTGSIEETFTIPNYVKSIEENSFYRANNLKRIVLNNNIKEIPNKAFFYCINLTNVEMTNSVEIIGVLAFARCESLEKIIIPEGVISIENSAFWICKNLEEVNIVGGLITIGNGSFDGCERLTKINIPQTLKFIGTGVFKEVPGPVSYYSNNQAMQTYKAQNLEETTYNILEPTLMWKIEQYKEKITKDIGSLIKTFPNINLNELKNNVKTNGDVKIYEKENEITNLNQKVKNGMKLKIALDNEVVIYKLIVQGDIDGDGDADVEDILEINRQRLVEDENQRLKGIYLEAGDVDEDGDADVEDMLEINRYRLLGSWE